MSNKIHITKLQVNNFRNIEKADYEFSDGKNAIAGKNAIGKTNVLEAISWVMVGKSIAGGSDDTANKPHSDLTKVVEVSVTISNGTTEHTITKRYTPLVADGKVVSHTSDIMLDGNKFATQKAAKSTLTDLLGIDGDKIGLYINPLRLSQIPYKDLRQYIISIIGDADEKDIYKENPVLKKLIGDDLVTFKNDIEAYSKYLNSESKKLKEEIKTKESILLFLQNDKIATERRFKDTNIDKVLIDIETDIRFANAKTNDKVNELTSKQTALSLYLNMRLEILNAKAKQVFGQVRWNFIEYNLKDMSYSEVCHPYIIGKDTKFDNGSTSEKVITGIAIINALCDATATPHLPILFDEGEALDSESIANKIVSPSQIITAKVSDAFITPTVIQL